MGFTTHVTNGAVIVTIDVMLFMDNS